MPASFDRVRIATRGEIAVRHARTLSTLGRASVAVYHPDDARALHVASADRAVALPGPDPRAAYLDADAIVAAAKQAGASAIHPGYGFLSEQARFARACEAAGIVFIGPRPETLEALGDKKSARQAARAAGVPITAGWEGVALDAAGKPSVEALAAGRELGFPLLVKAVMGGGGKGMRTITDANGLAEGLVATAREALSSFGDASIYFERRIEPARHVEIQFLGDGEGGVAHLFERECSLQRRHQKVIEESPAALPDDGLRARLVAATKAIAGAVKYRGAGTAEFLIDSEGRHYFLEVNARLQVEHPVTEMVTGHDLVALQIAVARGQIAGAALAAIERAAPNGHAIEARLYAEDPAHDFLPQSGRVAALRLPSGPGVRVDAGVRAGDEIGLHFDPMIAKISTWGPDRPAALARMARALAEAEVAGVATNLSYLRALVASDEVRKGAIATTWIEREHAPRWRAERKQRGLSRAALAAAGLAAFEAAAAMAATSNGSGDGENRVPGPWDRLAGFRVGGAR